MKALILLVVITLAGCQPFIKTKNDHTRLMVETVKSVCGAGKVTIESKSEVKDDDENSLFKIECVKTEEEGFIEL